MEYDKDRIVKIGDKEYYLNDWGVNKNDDAYQLDCDPCFLCDLCDECDRLADDLNNIEYCMCLSKGVIKDIHYMEEHHTAYFKKIN